MPEKNWRCLAPMCTCKTREYALGCMSFHRETLPTGVKFDDGKSRMDLLPSTPPQRIADVLAFGAAKYGEDNWRNGIKYRRLYAALQRHLHSWWDGQELDPETGISHLAHAGANVMFLLEFVEMHRTDLDDRYQHPQKASVTCKD